MIASMLLHDPFLPVAAGYNAVAISLAAGVLERWGLVPSPAIGAVVMSLSTIIVAGSAQLLRRVRL
jgi:Cu2+-exporting ATPase